MMVAEYYGILGSVTVVELLKYLVVAIILGYISIPFFVWGLIVFAVLWTHGASELVLYSVAVISIVISFPFIRRFIVSSPLMAFMVAMKFLPKISKTEKTAIDAGTIWMDAELFSGKPNFKNLMSQSYPALSEEEQAFLDGPCDYICTIVDDWEVHQNRGFSVEVWDYLKKNKFFGMIIPKEYGGLGFSASANSAVVSKLSSKSSPLGITVMVPNSLGPAELLVHYGTKEQKEYYLPRLANGEEIPCFALTEPQAGSDAGAMTSHGVVFKDKDGEIKLKINWKKRYITLAAISTVIGLAYKLTDPENLLGKGVDLGITCSLIPSSTPGVVLGKRHDPMGVPFYNCPTEGHNVIVSVDTIIGGKEGAGIGWKMLMESLSAGRGISLPANATGGIKLVARVTGAYTSIRKQFGISIGKFEGIHEPLSRMAGFSYIFESARRYTCGGLDSGAKPAVVTAIAKYYFTEAFRTIINDGMDVLGGAAISNGPRNLFSNPYKATPIGITVEGANILTRTLIIFGQGAIRCHPFVLDEVNAIENKDAKAFDKAFFGHVKHVCRNFCRSIVLSITRGHVASAPFGSTRRYVQKLSWASAKFALYADIALGTLGGDLKRKERLTGRFADVLGWMYLGTAVLKRFEHEGRRKEDLPLLHWSMQHALSEIQKGFQSIFDNMGFGYFITKIWTRINPIATPPSDDLGSTLARILQKPGEQRDRLTSGIFIPEDKNEALGRLEHAFKLINDVQPISKKLLLSIKKGVLSKSQPEVLFKEAVNKGVLTQEEADTLLNAEKVRRDAIQVDSFSLDDYLERAV
jgi:acyl-CoA dehydrogenase